MQKQRVVSGLCGAAGLWCTIVLISLSGCGSKAEGKADRQRVNASGKAEFDGKAIPAGMIMFTHLESGTVATCPISNGYFSNPRGEGPLIGKNAVTVVGKDKEDGKPLWGGVWSREVDVPSSKFEQDFKITADQVKPYVDKGLVEE